MGKLLRKIKPPIYGDVTLRLSFEFGVVLSEVAKKRGIEVTSDISARAEEILLKELKSEGIYRTAMNFTPLILAALEVEEYNN